MTASHAIPDAAPAALPEIFLTPEEHAQLSRLIGGGEARGVVGLLQQELDRATLCVPGERPAHAVGLNRWLHYTDDRAKGSRRVQIVMPQDADVDAGRISALSHVGSGLIGMLEGESILWPDPAGAHRKLTPILVEDPDDME